MGATRTSGRRAGRGGAASEWGRLGNLFNSCCIFPQLSKPSPPGQGAGANSGPRGCDERPRQWGRTLPRLQPGSHQWHFTLHPPPPHPHVALPCRCACLGRAATWRAPSDRKPPLPRPSWRPSLACGDDACVRQQSVHSVFSVPRLRSPLLRLDVLPPCSASECTPSPACHHPAWQRRPLVCFPFFQWLPPNCFPAVLPSPFSVPLLPAPLSQTMLQVRTR